MNCYLVILQLILNTHPATHNHKNSIDKMAKAICHYSKKRDLDPFLVVSIIKHESDFSYRLRSRTNDYGLMQLNSKKRISNAGLDRYKCDLFDIKCNINKGTRFLYVWRRACLKKHKHKSHWLRHYNWNSRYHHAKILWLTEAYRRALLGDSKFYNLIKSNKYRSIKIAHECTTGKLCNLIKRK